MSPVYPSDLTEQEWALLHPLIPPAQPGGRPRRWPLRHILNGIFYVLRTGCAWRYLPREYPPWPTVYHCFRVRHLFVDTLGLLLTVVVHVASLQDRA